MMRCNSKEYDPYSDECIVRMETTRMYRATTPTHFFWFGKVNPEEYFKTILITYVQNDTILFEKDKEDLTFGVAMKCGEESHYANVTLSQKETNLISVEDGSPIEIQIRTLDYAGNADASNTIRITPMEVLNDEVLR